MGKRNKYKPRRDRPAWRAEVQRTEEFVRLWVKRIKPPSTLMTDSGLRLYGLRHLGPDGRLLRFALAPQATQTADIHLAPPTLGFAKLDYDFPGTYTCDARTLAKYIVKHGGISADAFSRLMLEE